MLKFPHTERLSPPILQLDEVSFKYTANKTIFSNVNLGATLESRICIVRFYYEQQNCELVNIFIIRLVIMEREKRPY